MFEGVLRVKYVSFKNCFVYLSPSHKHLNTGICIKISNDENQFYFSASVIRNSVDSDSIGINTSYAKILGINENDFVNVQQVEQLPVVNSISIQPLTKSDYEVLELLSQNVQSNLLDQVRVVNARQKLIIWIGVSISLPVLVGNVQPISPGMLDFLTEVIIKPPDNVDIHKLKTNNIKNGENTLNSEQILSFFTKNSSNNPNLSYPKDGLQEDLLYRLIPLSELPLNLKKGESLPPFSAFICKKTSNQFYRMILLNSLYTEKKLFIKLCSLEDFFDTSNVIFKSNSLDNIFVDDSIINFMQSDFGARVLLKILTTVPLVNEIEVRSKKIYSINAVEKLKKYLADNCKPSLIWNASFPVEIDEGLYCSLKFLPNSDSYCIIDGEFLRNCSYSVCDELVRPLEGTQEKGELEKKLYMDISPAKDACDNFFFIFIRYNVYKAENIILCGKAGMGKSSILNHIAKTMKTYPYFVSTEIVYCKKIKGKTVDCLHKLFTDIFTKLIFTQPSLLILDDLHVLCEKMEGEESPNAVYVNRVSEMLHTLFSTIQEHNSVGILASAESVLKLNENMYRTRGNHLFKNIFTIGDLHKADRIMLFKYFFEQHALEGSLDYEELVLKTDGFVVQDLEDIYQKTLFESYKESCQKDGEPIIRQEHCDTALKKSCALSLQNVKFHSPGNKSFKDIGGLHAIKNTLVESLLWPLKYPSIFANAPLRLQSGILLYGPPGTGKTLLAGAAAKQCNLRLISVKGPELLSKYIGASEQAVRDVFEKAQRAKPCILFFDEFDSLAPRRGHDNTGVTDRVVNQLLTQLDGVEALTGVCVLAATSRPDLLDPALLRPGRLDKQLLCSMPNQSERLEILKILSTKLQLSEEANFEEISTQTEGYSGADLQSLLYTAQISSITDFDSDTDYHNKPVITKITQNILLEALNKTRPSLTKSERTKYELIYAKFQGGKVEDFRAGSKVTLA